jgi:hypothetical protein
MAESWADGTLVYLREPIVGASSVVWVDMYSGPEITPDNLDDDEIRREVQTAKNDAYSVAKHWRGMSYKAARAEYDAL